MAKPEYFNGTDWESCGNEGAEIDVQNSTGSPFPITGSLVVSTGSIEVDLGPELDALATFNQNGLVTRTGSGVYVGRELIAGNGIGITNANGVNGNPIVSLTEIPDPFINDLPINGDVNLETFNLTTTGNLSATTGSVITNNLASFNATNILVQNDLDLQNNSIINLPTPTIGSNPATKDYVDNNLNTSWYSATPSDVTFNLPISITGTFLQDFSHGYLNNSGTLGTVGAGSGVSPYSLDCTDRIKASEFNAYSSIKKKRILSQNKNVWQEATKLFKQIPFFKYEYKDQLKEGKSINYGVIAEYLHDILPEYVDMKSKDTVPNILSKGTVKQNADNSYDIKLTKSDFVVEGDILTIITSNGKMEVTIIQINHDVITVSSPEILPNQIYVYGTYETCPAVSLKKLFELSMVTTKNLLTRVERLEHQLKLLRKI